MTLLKPFFFLLILSFFACDKSTKEPELLVGNAIEFEGDGQGCASFIVYKANNDENLLLSISGDREKLGLDETEKEYDVNNEFLTVQIFKFDGPIGTYLCDDVAGDDGVVSEVWPAISGKVRIQITEDYEEPVEFWERYFKINVTLLETTIENGQQESLYFENIEFKEVNVGWLPG